VGWISEHEQSISGKHRVRTKPSEQLGVEKMANKTSKTETKRLPKGRRTHARRMKQAARKEASPNNPQYSPAQPVQAHKKQDQP
jgi:hypothetical protein